MEYGKALRMIMKEEDVSQAELARRMNTSTSYISQLCTGKISDPSLSRALEVAEALCVDISRFERLMRTE